MIESWRVAQLAVDRGPDHDGSLGSGYLVAPGRVLTAAHVVAGASSVRVRLDVDQDREIDVPADTWWADPQGPDGTDLAVVTIAETATAGRTTESVRFGRIGDSTAVLSVHAFGFPLFKLRRDPGHADQSGVFRDLEQVAGYTPVAANRRQGTLAVYLRDPPPPAKADGGPSPWVGMSGGPVWAAGRIVAVIAEHHASEGTGRLTARRIDRAYEQLSPSNLDQLTELLGLPAAVSGLPEVAAAEQGQLVRSAYLAQVRDIAPSTLIGRKNDLAAWTEGCAGTDPYDWWQAEAWAGKSALASWFVIHPPAGLDVVSFFITGRLSGQADSNAFLDAMIEQLDALNPDGERSPAVAGARSGVWLSGLTAAASRAAERARRLVVVVDGLDEDEAGTTPFRGRPSIASLLPRHPPPGVHFIVTSRLGRDLPSDVPSDHLLRTCKPHLLRASPVAQSLKERAKQELQDLLVGDQIAVDVVGYIAGSGGGLTKDNLSALARVSPYKLDPFLGSVFGRSFRTRAPNGAQDDPAARVYLFAHETLRETAENQLGNELDRYRERVHEWMDSYASAGWPDDTPGYATRGYPRLLTAAADVTRLSALARDSRRHAFLFAVTGSDYAALAEIGSAQSLIVTQKVPNLKALVELAAYRRVLSIRNRAIPPDLPLVWARLARFDHAENLIRTMADPAARTQALTGLATAAAQAGDFDRARRLATDAEALAHALTDPVAQARALTGLATAAAQAGDFDRARPLATDAEALARTLTDPVAQARALTDLATVAAQAGDYDRARPLATDAEALAHALTDPAAQARALTDLATAAAQAGDYDRLHRLTADAEALARTLTIPGAQIRALTGLATAAAQAGDFDRAEALTRTLIYPYAQTRALTDLATAAAQAGDFDRAHRLATEAEAFARSITDPGAQAQALTGLATAAAQAGDFDRAEAFARSITDPGAQAQALAGLVTVAAQAGDFDRAEGFAHALADPYDQAPALTGLAAAAAQAGDFDRARRLATDVEALAHALTDPAAQAQALTGLAAAAVQAGDYDRARRLATDVEALARTLTDPAAQAQALTGLAAAAAQAGDFDRAEALARSIADSEAQARALTGLATAAAQAGDFDRAHRLATDAETLAHTFINPYTHARALTDLATAAAQVGDYDRARRLATDVEALARTLTDPAAHARALTSLASVVAQAGDFDRAEALARSITDSEAQAQALTGLATAAAQADDLDRARDILALILVMDLSGTWWVESVLQLFPSVAASAWDVLARAYSPWM